MAEAGLSVTFPFNQIDCLTDSGRVSITGRICAGEVGEEGGLSYHTIAILLASLYAAAMPNLSLWLDSLASSLTCDARRQANVDSTLSSSSSLSCPSLTAPSTMDASLSRASLSSFGNNQIIIQYASHAKDYQL